MPLTRREMLKAGLATAALSQFPLAAFGASETETVSTLVPFLDALPANPNRPMIRWDKLTDWITPEADFFSVQHYGVAKVDAGTWALEISGLVNQPQTCTLAQRPLLQ